MATMERDGWGSGGEPDYTNVVRCGDEQEEKMNKKARSWLTAREKVKRRVIEREQISREERRLLGKDGG